MTNIPKNFEQAIEELEIIVSQIENNDIALDAALEKYQQGIALIKLCQTKLTEAEQQIKILDPESNTLKDLQLK